MPAYAGGAAYDPRHDATWVSDGKSLELMSLANCKVMVSVPAQVMNPAAVVSGLACYDGGRRLLQLETMPGYAALRSYDVTTLAVVPLRDGCTLPLPTNTYCAGLAIDEASGTVWVSVTEPRILTARNFMRASRLSSKCVPLCEFEIPVCGPPLIGSEVTGLAFDICTSRLFASFSLHTLPIKIIDAAKCSYRLEPCCDKGLAGKWRGLALRSTASLRFYAWGCTGKGCQNCPNLRTLPFGGLPAVGNSAFGFDLVDAPLPSFAIMIVGAGRCTKGLGLPFLCGAIYPSLQPPTFFLGPFALTGSGQCQGTLTLPLPIPADPGLCGAELCFQWVVICGSISDYALTSTYEATLR